MLNVFKLKTKDTRTLPAGVTIWDSLHKLVPFVQLKSEKQPWSCATFSKVNTNIG